MFTPAAQPKGVIGAITELLKTTAHIPKLSDTAPFGVLLHDGLPPLHVEKYLDVTGYLKAAFVRPEMQLRMEIWQRVEPPSGGVNGQSNLRVILDSSGVTTHWDLGPSPRRLPGGALDSIGGLQESEPIEIGNRRYLFRAMLNVLPNELPKGSLAEFTSYFEMVPLTKQRFGPWTVSEGDPDDYFKCALEFDDQTHAPHLTISTHGWQSVTPRSTEDPARLYRRRENEFRPLVPDARKIFDE